MAGGTGGTGLGTVGAGGQQNGTGIQLPSWVTQQASSGAGTQPVAGQSNNTINGYVGNSRTSSMGTLDRSLGLQGPTSAGNTFQGNTQQQGSFGPVPLAPLPDPNGGFQLAQSYNANPQMPDVPGTNLMGHPAWAGRAWAAGNGSWTEGGEGFDAARQALQGPQQNTPFTGDKIGNPKAQQGAIGQNNQVGPVRMLPGGGATTFPVNHPQAPDYNGQDPGKWIPYGQQQWVPGMPLIAGGATPMGARV